MATYFVNQGGSGAADGSSLGNAASVATLNSHTLSPGDVVSLNGTLTSAITVHDSGTNGSPITYLFAAGAKMSSACWVSGTGAIRIASKDWIVIDGGATGTIGGYGATGVVNGLIENTANGTGLANDLDSDGIRATQCNNLTIKNLAIINIYVRLRGPAPANNQFGSSLSNLATSDAAITNFVVTNCFIHDAYVGINSDYGASSTNYTFSFVTAYNCNWGGRCADRNGLSTMSELIIHDCYFHDWINWDDTSGNNYFHHNGFYTWAEAGGTITGGTYYNIVLGPNYGGAFSTSGLFWSGQLAGTFLVYNCIGTEATAGDAPANGILTWQPTATATATFRVYNNTFYGNAGAVGTAGIAVYMNLENAGTGSGLVMDIRNNIFQGVATAIARFNSASTTMTVDYDVGYNLGSGTEYSDSTSGASSYNTFAQWQGLGYDIHGSNATPNLSATYVPKPVSSAINAGTTLSTYFTVDYLGTPRPNGSAWDIGAFETILKVFKRLGRRLKIRGLASV